MRIIAFALALLLSGMGALAQTAAPKYAHTGIAKDAQRYEDWLKTNYGTPAPKKNPQARATADKIVAAGTGDMRAAARLLASAVAADPADADAWVGLAKALLAITPDPNKGSERYELPLNASGAAYTGYLRARGAPAQARALAVLAEALKRRSYWRPAIEALKVSLALADNADVRQSYEKLRAEHGFRLTDYQVESDVAEPRLCLQFSEGLQRGQVDFSKFVSVDGHDPQGVSAEGAQLCVEGLEHGKRYEVLLRAGLPSDVGEPLIKQSEIGVYVKDRAPTVRFTGRAYVLPSRGQQGLPVVSINAARVNVEVYRIGDRSLVPALTGGDIAKQLSTYELDQLRDSTGQKVWSGELETQAGKLNEEVSTAIPVGDAIPQLQPGVYAMVAWPTTKSKDADYSTRATQWFIVSDLGLSAFTGDTGVHAFVRSLATSDPVTGVNVKLVAKNNEVLAQAKTDAEGYVRFEPGLARGEGGQSPAVLVAEGTGDYAFLDLTTSAFDLSDRGVKGRETPGGLDAFIYAERGVYRPGESVALTALVRDRAGKASQVPMTLIVTRPDGVEHKRIALTSPDLGGHSTVLPLAGSAMTGTWKAKLYADPKADPLAAVSFLVEDFVPERLDMMLTPQAKTIAPEESQTVNLAGRYLYGPPAADLAIEADVVVKAASHDLPGLDGYVFGRADEKISAVRKSLEQLPTTDDKGNAAITVTLPAIPKTAKPLDADVIVRLREPGGRTIERTTTLAVDPREPRLGIKPLFSTLGEGEAAGFDVVVLDAAGKRAASKAVAWTLYRLDQTWQWYNRDGSWTYDSVTLSRKTASGSIDVAAETPARITVTPQWGRYRLEIASTEAGGPMSSYLFTSGWWSGEAADTPEVLEVALDRPAYAPGDTAKLKIATRTGGKALVTVLGNGMLDHKLVDVPRGGGEVPVTVGSEWGAGAYVTAMLYRPLDEAQKRMPSRAVGLKWLGIDQGSRTLSVKLDTPAKVPSGGHLVVPVRLDGLTSGEEARITVAAVDLGILNLTRYQPPAPESWFYAQTRLGVDIRDLYGRLIDGMRANRGRLRSGGDEGGGMAMNGTPPVEQLVALYSGIVKVGADGRAQVAFDLPDFNGTVRVMAVAWSGTRLGHASSDVIVRDPVALTASLPRFLTLGDEARLGIDVHNVEGAAGTYKIAITQDVGGKPQPFATRDVALNPNQRKSEPFTLKPQDVGLTVWNVDVTGPGGIDVKRRLTIDVKPPAGDVRRVQVAKLRANGGKIEISNDLLTDLIPSRTGINVSVGPLAALDVPGLLTSLDRYPYGCAEQTTSRALPLLYANQLAVQVGMPKDADLRLRIQGAVDRVLEMQDSTGAFGVWGPHNGDLWLSSYVMDFLTRAKETGFTVNALAYSQGLDRLANFIAYAQDFEKGGEDRAYALYVLARNGRAPAGELRYYVDTRLDRFASSLAKAQLGAALAMLGDKERAEKAFAAALGDSDKLAADDRGWRSDYGSRLRDGAALVALASESHIAVKETPRLVNVLAQAFSRRTYTSTQEQAWMLLAARALAEQAKETRLDVNGTLQDGALNRRLTATDLNNGAVTVTNTGNSEVDAVVSVIGAALTPEPATSKGFAIERSYYTLDGKKVDLKSGSGGQSQLAQTDRLVTVIKIEAKEQGGRVLLVDRLPAGLEIENPHLVDSGDLKQLAWLKSPIKPEHTEFRDDRFVAAFNLSGKSGASDDDDDTDADSNASTSANAAKGPVASATVAYIVRAVTPGSFVHPAATVEDMYRPERYARTAAGRLDVVAKQ